MSKRNKFLTEEYLKNQLSFLHQMGGTDMLEAGKLDINFQIKSAISKMITRSQKSRWQIIADINELCNTDFQKSTLDGRSAESREDDELVRMHRMGYPTRELALIFERSQGHVGHIIQEYRDKKLPEMSTKLEADKLPCGLKRKHWPKLSCPARHLRIF